MPPCNMHVGLSRCSAQYLGLRTSQAQWHTLVGCPALVPFLSFSLLIYRTSCTRKVCYSLVSSLVSSTRVCRKCSAGKPEDECHVVFECAAYNDLRSSSGLCFEQDFKS